jgi:O-antigen/teichoic acid export membrane protein
MSESDVDTRQVTVARGTFLGVRADIANAVSMIVASIVVARALGPENRGIFFIATLVASYIALVGDVGMSTANIVFGANRRVGLGELHGMALAFSLVAGALGAILLLPFEEFWTDTVLKGLDMLVLVLVCAAIPLLLYGQIIVALLTGMGNIPVTATARIGMAIAYPVVLTPLAVITGSPEWSLAAWLVSLLGYAVGLGVYTTLRVSRPARPRLTTLRTVLSFGVRSYIGTLSYHGFLRIDIFFLSARFGPALVGVYSLASVVAERISIIGQAVYSASASRIGGGSRVEAATLTATVLRLLVLVMVPAAIALALLSWPTFPLIFGDDFADASLPFTLLLPGTVCLTLWAVTSLFIISALERPGITTLIQGSALLLSLPLYYVAVREGEMTGAAIVSSAVYAGVLLAAVIVLLRNSTLSARDLLPRGEDVGLLGQAFRDALGRGARA